MYIIDLKKRVSFTQDRVLLSLNWIYYQSLRGCLPKILTPILEYITDFLKTFCVIYTLVG